MFTKFFLAFACLIFSVSAFAADPGDPFVRDLNRITEWFEGEFDNEEQVWFHTRSASTEPAPTRLHVRNTRLDLPAFGDRVFYTEEYTDNDPENIIRQRLVVFSSDRAENAIRMRQGFFKKPDKVLGGQNLDRLKPRDVTFLDTCDVFFRRVADQLNGSMKPKACVFGEGAERRYSQHDIVLSSKKFWRTDATFLTVDDSFYKGTPVGKPMELRRARIYICEYYFYPEKSDAFPEAGDVQIVKDLRIHSQGGIASVVRESDGQEFELLIREKEYPYHKIRSDFIYYSLRRKGETISEAFGVADRASRHFGTNAGRLGAFCHREGYTFNETFK